MFIQWIDLPNLETFTSGEYSFRETTNVTLSSIVTEDGQSWDSTLNTYYAPFENVKSVEISSIF